jgi:hypothetical protein
MLDYTPFALSFVYTLWRFYAFSRTNLLTRCHSASTYFLLFLCFRKVTHEIFSELDKTKAEVPNYLTRRQSPKKSRRQTKGQPHQVVPWGTPRPRHQVVWPPGPPPDIALTPIYSPRRENPKGPNSFPENILQAAAIVDVRSGGSRSSSRHLAREGNHHQRPSSSPLPASGVIREYSTLDYGSIAVVRWMSSPSMCFMFRSCELPIMIKIIVM